MPTHYNEESASCCEKGIEAKSRGIYDLIRHQSFELPFLPVYMKDAVGKVKRYQLFTMRGEPNTTSEIQRNTMAIANGYSVVEIYASLAQRR